MKKFISLVIISFFAVQFSQTSAQETKVTIEDFIAEHSGFEVNVDGEIKTGTYSRSRSGCFFCFLQQKIEWVWLLEQHPELFAKAVEYEKDGYTWSEEPLTELMKPERVNQIKANYIKKTERDKKHAQNQLNWKDEILNSEGIGCSSCFI